MRPLAAALAPLCSILAFAQAASTRPPITGIAYVRFYESDLAAAKVFYAQRLGLSETDTGLDSAFTVNAHQSIEITALPTPAPRNRLAEVALQTPDIPGMKSFLSAHRIVFDSLGPNEIRLHDPEGNPIAFVNQPLRAVPSQASPVPTSARIIHAGWGVRSQATEDAFFIELLGFRPYWHGGRKAGESDWVSLQVPDGSEWIEYMLEYKPATDTLRQLGGQDHVSLGVTHITDVTDDLVANGWTDPSTRKAQIGLDGKWQLNVFDPDQSRIEFMEFRPIQEPCCSAFTASHPTP